MKDVIYSRLVKLESWVEEHNYKGYEPFDGLSSYLRPLTFGSLFMDRLLLQLVRQSPINLRPLLGIKPLDSTIGRGYMAWGYLTMLKATQREEYRTKALNCLDWLMENRSPGYPEFCWGKHFDFASRGGRYPKLEPITVWTSLIGMAYMEAYEVLGEKRYLGVADSICKWIMKLPRNEYPAGVCLNYTGSGEETVIVHNHNMLAAAVLAKIGARSGEREYLDLARRAMDLSCSRQLADGAWYYGEDPMHHWIDNFHTGYNLNALKSYVASTGDNAYEPNLRRGFQFYISHFFEDNGRPKYYHSRTYPVDSQCISQSIDTLVEFADIEPSAQDMALKVAQWAMDNMLDERGFFYYRQYPLLKAKTPMLHWAQATTYRALALLFARLSR